MPSCLRSRQDTISEERDGKIIDSATSLITISVINYIYIREMKWIEIMKMIADNGMGIFTVSELS